MRSELLTVLTSSSTALALTFSSLATQAYCPGDEQYYSVESEYQRANYVVAVRVASETWLGEDGQPKALEPPFQEWRPRPWGFDPYAGAFYDVVVTRSFKGPAPHDLRLFSENSTARFWMDVGNEELLFITQQQFDAPIGLHWTVDTCGNSRLLGKASATVRKIEHLELAQDHQTNPDQTAR